MMGLVDLHCHYLPDVDDGVRTREEGIELLRGLKGLGYELVIATPHIRQAMFDNRKAPLEEAFAAFDRSCTGDAGLPARGLAAEHFFDDVFWSLFQAKETLPYPGGKAALVEFAYESIPVHVDRRFFDMNRAGIRPVLAHPERYSAAWKSTDPLEPFLNMGVVPLLDVMSLTGKYGRQAQRAAERMLDEDVYYAACTDSHKPSDVPIVREAIKTLVDLIGEDDAEELLSDRPRRILEGRVVL